MDHPGREPRWRAAAGTASSRDHFRAPDGRSRAGPGGSLIYVDSSMALAPLLSETRSPPERVWRQQLVSSRLLEYEVWNRVHAYRLTDTHGGSARNLLA